MVYNKNLFFTLDIVASESKFSGVVRGTVDIKNLHLMLSEKQGVELLFCVLKKGKSVKTLSLAG